MNLHQSTSLHQNKTVVRKHFSVLPWCNYSSAQDFLRQIFIHRLQKKNQKQSFRCFLHQCVRMFACVLCVLPVKVCAALLLHHNVLCWPAHLPLGCVSRGHPRRREPCFFTLPSPGMRCDLINTYGYLLMSLSSELSVVSAVRYTESGASLPTPRKGLIAHDGLIWKGCCI